MRVCLWLFRGLAVRLLRKSIVFTDRYYLLDEREPILSLELVFLAVLKTMLTKQTGGWKWKFTYPAARAAGTPTGASTVTDAWSKISLLNRFEWFWLGDGGSHSRHEEGDKDNFSELHVEYSRMNALQYKDQDSFKVILID